jgi:RNA polymerase sigma-70 factor, ECF subfamily
MTFASKVAVAQHPSDLIELRPLRPWLFRIPHNRAIDYPRRYERRMSEPLEAVMDFAAEAALEPDNALSREDTVRIAVTRFLELPPAQRSCLILKDVLEIRLTRSQQCSN